MLERVYTMNFEEKIRNHIAKEILFTKNGYTFSDEASFLEEGIIDSTSVLELVLFVEDKFGIAVDDEEIIPDHFDSVSLLANFVRQKQS